MTPQEFQGPMNRLIEQFGKNVYSQARVNLIYREVGNLSAGWWERVVDKLIGECRNPPLMPELRELMAYERERCHAKDKERQEQDAQAFYASTFHSEDIKETCQSIIKRAQGRLPDRDWEAFMRSLNSAGKAG